MIIRAMSAIRIALSLWRRSYNAHWYHRGFGTLETATFTLSGSIVETRRDEVSRLKPDEALPFVTKREKERYEGNRTLSQSGEMSISDE